MQHTEKFLEKNDNNSIKKFKSVNEEVNFQNYLENKKLIKINTKI